jgi:hypothetical protein
MIEMIEHGEQGLSVHGRMFNPDEIDQYAVKDAQLVNSVATLEPEIAEKSSSEAENPRGEETPEVDVTAETEEKDEQMPDEPEEVTRSNLQGLIDQYTANPDDVDTFADVGTRMENDNRPPYVISQKTYAGFDDEHGEDYEKITLTYFPRSRVLLDEDDEVIDDIANVVGWRNLSRFGDESGDDDTVFVRCPRLMTDYEVVKDEESPLPLHVKYGMPREEFEVSKAAGTLRLRDEDT